MRNRVNFINIDGPHDVNTPGMTGRGHARKKTIPQPEKIEGHSMRGISSWE
jgi:hypothetical protein